MSSMFSKASFPNNFQTLLFWQFFLKVPFNIFWLLLSSIYSSVAILAIHSATIYALSNRSQPIKWKRGPHFKSIISIIHFFFFASNLVVRIPFLLNLQILYIWEDVKSTIRLLTRELIQIDCVCLF